MTAIEELEPRPTPEQQLPVVYETQVSHALALSSQMRGASFTISMVTQAERQRDRIRDVLSESGIELVSTHQQPPDLGYDQRKFVVLGKRTSLDEIMEQAHAASPELSIVAKTPLKESLDDRAGLPFVLKRPLRDTGGINKFLITCSDQVKKLEAFFEERSYACDDWVTEPYIETPGDVNSSYRLVVTATGLVIASALLHKPRLAGEKAEASFTDRLVDHGASFKPYTERKNKDGWVDFADRGSKWFLDADAITSNVASGGNIIPLKIAGELGTEPRLTEKERKILDQHGITDLETPAALLRAAAALGKQIGPHMALMLGIDFLQDQKGQYHLLEINPFPGTDSILTWWGLDPSKSKGDSRKQDRISDDLIRIVGDSLQKLTVSK